MTMQGAIPAWMQWALAQETDDCISWPFAKIRRGYGQFGTNKGGTKLAHREICRMAHGDPPAGDFEAAHSCGNRPCCNKRHLSWKTPKQNKADELQHGTRNRGERHGHAKLTREAVTEIRNSSSTPTQLAAQYRVSEATIRDAIARRTWGWL